MRGPGKRRSYDEIAEDNKTQFENIYNSWSDKEKLEYHENLAPQEENYGIADPNQTPEYGSPPQKIADETTAYLRKFKKDAGF